MKNYREFIKNSINEDIPVTTTGDSISGTGNSNVIPVHKSKKRKKIQRRVEKPIS